MAILANAMSTNYETRSQRLNALLGALGSVLPTLSRQQRRGLLLRAGGDAKLAAALATGEFGAPRRVAATPVAGSVTGLVVTGRKLLSAVVRRVAPAAAARAGAAGHATAGARAAARTPALVCGQRAVGRPPLQPARATRRQRLRRGERLLRRPSGR